MKPFVPTRQGCQSELQTGAYTSYTCSNLGESSNELPICNDNRTGNNGSTAYEFEQDNFEQADSSELASQLTSFRLKEKTEICKNWLNEGCRFGDRCAFAHGYDEILLK